MAVQSYSGNATVLDRVWAYATKKVEKDLLSSIYKRSPILTFFAGKLKSETPLGRPGTLAIMGGAGNFDAAQKASELQAEVHDRFQVATVGGSKWMGETDTTPTTGNDAQPRHIRSAVHRWAGPLSTPIKVDQQYLRLAPGGAQIANPITDAVDMAMEEHFDLLAIELWRGNPSDQSANVWNRPLGIVQALDTDNTYGNVNRSTYPTFAGRRVTTATSPALNIIDQANIGAGVMSGGLQDKGPGPDLWIVAPENFYRLKQEAIARGQHVTVSNMPAAAEVGVELECIKYGRNTIVYDPLLTGNWSAYDSDITDASKIMVGLNSEDWIFSVHPQENFRVTKFQYQGDRPGGDDATTARIQTMPRMRCRRPWRSVLFTNVA